MRALFASKPPLSKTGSPAPGEMARSARRGSVTGGCLRGSLAVLAVGLPTGKNSSLMYSSIKSPALRRVSGSARLPLTLMRLLRNALYIMLRGISLVTPSTKRLRRTPFSLGPAVKLFIVSSLKIHQ